MDPLTSSGSGEPLISTIHADLLPVTTPSCVMEGDGAPAPLLLSAESGLQCGAPRVTVHQARSSWQGTFVIATDTLDCPVLNTFVSSGQLEHTFQQLQNTAELLQDDLATQAFLLSSDAIAQEAGLAQQHRILAIEQEQHQKKREALNYCGATAISADQEVSGTSRQFDRGGKPAVHSC